MVDAYPMNVGDGSTNSVSYDLAAQAGILLLMGIDKREERAIRTLPAKFIAWRPPSR